MGTTSGFSISSRFFYINTGSGNSETLAALASQIVVSIDRAKAHDEIEELNKKLIQENLYYLDEKEEFRPFGEIVGASGVVMTVQRSIRKVAPTQSTVLIQGETGVGKELG
jgi:formate hydrogenlyase transcriptional activator